MEPKSPQYNIEKKEEQHLSGMEGIQKLKESSESVQGISFKEFLKTEEGQEFLKSKKIILAGPPRSGKSCMREALKQAIKSIPNAPYPYMLTACPDGEGAWFQEAMNNNPEEAAKYKVAYKSKFTSDFVERISQSVKNLSLPLNFIDIGGITSAENEKICKDANAAILICGEGSVLSNKPAEWKEFFTKLGIPVMAEIYSDYTGKDDMVEGVDVESGVFRGSVHHLERGEQLAGRETVQALAKFIVEPNSHLKENKTELLSLEQINQTVNKLILEWQNKLPEVKIVLGGSLVSGLFILDNETKEVDVDVRFLTNEQISQELINKIEEVTGLKYRKEIEVSDWPTGKSNGIMIEGKINIQGFPLPLDIEGCLRNEKYVGWAKFYKQVLTPEELSQFLEEKKKTRRDKSEYKALKQKVLTIVMQRCIEQGIVSNSNKEQEKMLD